MGSMKPLVRRRSTSTSRLTSARCSSLRVLKNLFASRRNRRARPRFHRSNSLRRMRLRRLAGNSRNLRSRMLLSLRLNRGLARRLLRLANRFIRTHRLLHLALVRRLVLVLRRLTRGFMLPMRAVRGVSDRMNADFTYAFNIIIKVFVFRLIVARLHTFQWAIAKHRRTFFTAGPETMYQ